MIIGIDASRANRDRKSGTEWYSYYLIKYFAQLDPTNQYILYTDKPLQCGLLDLSDMDFFKPCLEETPKYDEKGYQIIKSPHNNFKGRVLNWPFSFFWTLGRLSFRMLVEKPDILFVPAHGLPMIGGKKNIATVHDVSFRHPDGCSLYEKKSLGPVRHKFVRSVINLVVKILTLGKYEANSFDYLDWSTRHSMKHADKIITISQATRDDIMKIYCSGRNEKYAEKIKVIYNGFNDQLYKKIADEAKIDEVLERYGLKRPYFLYVGRLEKKKNSSLLVEAFAKAKYLNKDIKEKLVLVGEASFGYDELKYIINEYHLNEEVVMPGWVKEEDMPYVFSGATAFVFPSRHEGFGIPVLQAMNCGVPVVVSNILVLHEVVGRAGLFFDHNSKEDLAEALNKIATDQELRKSLIAEGMKRAKDFSWEKCAKETLREILD